MPVFLSLNAVPVEVVADGAEELEPLGLTRTRAFAGGLRTVAAQGGARRRWRFRTRPLTAAELAAIRATYANGAHVTAAGDAMPSGGVTVGVTESGAGYVQDLAQSTGYQTALTLTLEQV